MSTSSIANRIAAGHAYKHVERGEFDGSRPKYGDDTGVRNRDDFESHIKETLEDEKTRGFIKENGQEQYYNDQTNTFVGFDEHGEGTCFRPSSREEYLESQFQEDVRAGGADDPGRIKVGGYEGLNADRQARDSGADKSGSRDQGGLGEDQIRPGSAERGGPESTQESAEQAPQRNPPPSPPPPPQKATSDDQGQSQGRSR